MVGFGWSEPLLVSPMLARASAIVAVIQDLDSIERVLRVMKARYLVRRLKDARFQRQPDQAKARKLIAVLRCCGVWLAKVLLAGWRACRIGICAALRSGGEDQTGRLMV